MPTIQTKKILSAKVSGELLAGLKNRFLKHPDRHPGLAWADVSSRLRAAPGKLWSLHEMERTGGEPDVTGYEGSTGAFLFVDCSPESPKARVSVCYDLAGLESRKEHRPENSAVEMAAAMGVELLNEAEYQALQTRGTFDLKTSSWVRTGPEIRQLGGALYAERRYGRVFIGHNGAQSYYNSRGFRCRLWV